MPLKLVINIKKKSNRRKSNYTHTTTEVHDIYLLFINLNFLTAACEKELLYIFVILEYYCNSMIIRN